MATATATWSMAGEGVAAASARDGGAGVPSSLASHGLAALAQKLQHPLVRIRARALASLLFKLRERLVDAVNAPPLAVDALMRALVVSLTEKELEATALQVLQLLLLDGDERATRVCAEALRRHGAAAAFQRGGVAAGGDTQQVYEALLHRLLATSSAMQEEEPSAVVSQPMATTYSEAASVGAAVPFTASLRDSTNSTSAVRTATATVTASAAARRTSSSDPLTSEGWRFPHVPLAAVDEQSLFEFEVKWRLRTSVPEIVEMCDTFRRQLLRDFPAEVFLQRPSILLRVLELVRQPIVPAVTTPELSFGVNYFDEPASRGSFVWKPSVHATALHVSMLKAIESWLSALHHSVGISLNPMYHTFQSPSSFADLAISTLGYDHKRFHYPRVTNDAETTDREDEPGLSLSGAAFVLVATLMRLLSSENYPHLHLLNTIHIATEFLPERSAPRSGAGVSPLDKTRFEALLIIVADVTRVKESMHDELVMGSIMEWLIIVIRVLGTPSFCVEDQTSTRDSESSSKIEIPLVVWKWLLRQLALRQLADEARVSSIIQLINHIDSEASTTIKRITRSIEYNAHLAVALRDPSHPSTLQLAQQVIRFAPNLRECDRSRAARIVLEAVCGELDHRVDSGDYEQTSTDQIGDLLLCALMFMNPKTPSQLQKFSVNMSEGLIDWMLEDGSDTSSNRRLKAVLHSVSTTDDYFHLLLCYLAASRPVDFTADTLWRLAELMLRALESTVETSSAETLMQLLPKSMAVLQHLAYIDSNGSITNDTHRRLQRTLMHLVQETEAKLSAAEQWITISRCLIHRSAFVRRAAASELVTRLDEFGFCTANKFSDPFGQFEETGKGEHQLRVIEHELPSILQPRTKGSSDVTVTSISGSSVLHRASRLRKLLSSLAATADETSASASVSTLQQILIDLTHADPTNFALLKEAGEVEELLRLSIRLVTGRGDGTTPKVQGVRASSLSIIRVLLLRCAWCRAEVRKAMGTLVGLLMLVFDEDPRIRAEMYWIVLALTCTMENVILNRTSSEVVGVAEFSTTFGLLSEKWWVSGVSVQAISEALQPPTHDGGELLETLGDVTPMKLTFSDSLEELWNDLVDAKSFRTYLDALYALLQACHARQEVRAMASARWEDASFRRYLETPPTSAKDQVIMAANIALLNVVFDEMSRDQQMDVVLLLRQKIIPLQLTRTQNSLKTTALSAEFSRLLLRVSRSLVKDMFVPLLVDTGFMKYLGELIVSSGVSGSLLPLQQSLWLQVAHTALECEKAQIGDRTGFEYLYGSLRMPLQAVVGRHHVPGSFQEHDSYVCAVSCLVTSSAGEHDSLWRTRLLFDTSSSLRSVGFQIAALSLGAEDPDDSGRILRLARDTMRDDTECDAVRSSAVDLLHEFFRRVERAALPQYGSSIDEPNFIPDLIDDLMLSTRAREKCTARLTLSQLRLVRFFISHADRFASTSYGDVLDLLVSNDEKRPSCVITIVELLSIRNVFASYQHHSIEFLRIQSAESTTWHRSILPVVLTTISEAANLLQAIVRTISDGQLSLQAAPLMLQLGETISDISKSLAVLTADAAAANSHYDALDQCGKLLALVLSTATPTALPSDILDKLVPETTALLHPTHPRRFRLSFTRTVAAILCHPSGARAFENDAPSKDGSIVTCLWDTYLELCEHQPMDPIVSHRRTDSFLLHLRRTAFALHILFSRSRHAAAFLRNSRSGSVQAVIHIISESFAAVRLAAGISGKGPKSSSDDSFALELFEAIKLHCLVLSGIFVHSSRAQDIARDMQLPSVLANNWNVMRAAYRKGSAVLVRSLQLLQNFIHRNDANKASLATTTATTTSTRSTAGTARDVERNLLVLVCELAIGGSTSLASNERWSTIAGKILKSAFLQVECLHSAIKTGLVSKLFDAVVATCRRHRESSRALSYQDEQTLVELIGVLTSISCLDEGRQLLLQMKDLRGLIDDIFHFAESSKLSVAGTLFIRNLAFSKFSKTHFSVWEPALDQILGLLCRWGSVDSSVLVKEPRRVVAADHLSTALLCCVHDNQRAQSVLQGSAKAIALLRDAVRLWGRYASDSQMEGLRRLQTVSSNLERVSSIIVSDSTHDGP